MDGNVAGFDIEIAKRRIHREALTDAAATTLETNLAS
jgi:hypothetical protein